MTSYTPRIGDVCFMIIGQITGRMYLPIRYQPTGCIVLNCPTHDPAIATAVRAIWSSPNPTQHLFDSLLSDLYTESANPSKDYSGQFEAVHLQSMAAMRLLYYFPRATGPLIAALLHGPGVYVAAKPGAEKARDQKIDAYERSTLPIGANRSEFISAVAWYNEPIIRTELQAIFRYTDSLLIETLSSIPPTNQQLILTRFETLLDTLPREESVFSGGPAGYGYALLVALGGKIGSAAKPAFHRYMLHAGMQRRHTLCLVLREVCKSWDVEMLTPLLTDRRHASTYIYPFDGISRGGWIPVRICDEAAKTLSKNHVGLSFRMAGTHANLDRQIAILQTKLRHISR